MICENIKLAAPCPMHSLLFSSCRKTLRRPHAYQVAQYTTLPSSRRIRSAPQSVAFCSRIAQASRHRARLPSFVRHALPYTIIGLLPCSIENRTTESRIRLLAGHQAHFLMIGARFSEINRITSKTKTRKVMASRVVPLRRHARKGTGGRSASSIHEPYI